ncbi:cytochrome o ubiquinol oxidase subunit 3 [Waddlia chondrophila 2032/99]|uniref:Cytochrome bo(3) ubiquinol oxidase subunit 3 n=2 Tax=Waddlia chondrophila TaxID=71667 RepID=D6YUP7_WADCW|nr:cytochrome o ubiquinol oxidase subunit III [Waddlia chondrophila]ADI37858.1 cytochrome o ubiquinol oxidase, subunit III [Waddlia chondrophila WSU 86-1044]CCB92020.1 cytochrome o ubiquinol oxidase subunit 3 [Waddlia chondrophila 2032/99]
MTDSLIVHHTPEPNPNTSVPDPHQDYFSMRFIGFWVYLMTDCILFATLFITHAVLQANTFGGPSSKDLFDLRLAFGETFVLLISSVTCGLAVLAAVHQRLRTSIAFLGATIALGLSFLTMEISEFHHFISEGHSWTVSAFLSSFFALVGTHGLHITFGLIWASAMICQLFYYGLTIDTFRRLVLFSLFWHFLDLIWIFIFTFVYLIGVI